MVLQEYVSGCIWALKEKNYHIKGFECVIAGNIPVGAGLSSSAALELAILKAASYSSDFLFDKVAMAKIGQHAENNWVGVNCGIMDQLISSAGKLGHALLIDCRDLSLKECPIPEDASVVILDTDTRRDLVSSAYNERREQCFKAAGIMGVEFLRDASKTMLNASCSQMDENVHKRAKHIILENARVLKASQVMNKGDAKALGRLMYESHESLRDDFEVTNSALDAIVECSQNESSCFGSRMTGAGFGGCAVALVKKGQENQFIESVSSCYKKKTGLTPQIYICRPSEGVTLKDL
jgi:galactokinase